jgi:putative membrane protein insertion efficiency factor
VTGGVARPSVASGARPALAPADAAPAAPPAPPRGRVQRAMLAAVEAYQRAFEGRPSPCRFSPSCSSYAHEALSVHGPARGGWLTLRRLLRCRPFGPTGYDPVPDPATPPAPDHSARRHVVERG